MPRTVSTILKRIFEQKTFRRVRRNAVSLTLVLSVSATGCVTNRNTWQKTVGNATRDVDRVMSEIDNPSPPIFHEASATAAPVTAETVSETDLQYVGYSLNDVLREALQHSQVLRDIGGVILRSPESMRTNLAARIQEADPRYGMEAALSAFDAQLAASAAFNSNNRLYNNAFFAGGTTAFEQDIHDYQVELSKRTAVGSLLAVRGINSMDANNAPANSFSSAWDSWLEAEIRQPLLQGAGLEFNRIAGPGATPGVYNGVLIAKANSDINQHDFSIALTDFVSNVENAYWDLYVSYRELDARKKAMEQALVIWNEAKARVESGSMIADEALARQQYYQLKGEVDEALSGRLLPGTQVRNGSTGGTVQAGGGVLSAERRLRLLCGMPASDGTLIQPTDEPTMANIEFDWDSSLHEAMTLRAEIQKQNIAVKKRELELLASRNFINPRLDAVGRYRVRGFGDNLIGSGNQGGTTPASSLGNLSTGEHGEWMLGVEYTVPIGYRKAHAAVDHAELLLVRERTILKEQQREIVSNLGGATADVVRAYQSVQNNLNQYLASQSYFEALQSQKYGPQKLEVEADKLLDAQRRVVSSEIQFFRSRAEYAVSLKNFHYEKGSLMAYKDLRIADSSLPETNGPQQVSMSETGVEGGPTLEVSEEPPMEVPLVPGEEETEVEIDEEVLDSDEEIGALSVIPTSED